MLIRRGLTLYDIYTDINICYLIYKTQQHQIWFALSAIFIITPFILTWNVAIRVVKNDFIDKYDKYENDCMKNY